MANDDSSVRVAVRIRPQVASELIDMCRICTRVTPDEPQVTLGSDKSFTFDHVFDMDSTQQEVYDTSVMSLVNGSLDGYNATVLAYGQTGSGKTYTMGTGFEVETTPEQIGIIPRAIHQLFEGVEETARQCRESGQIPPEFKVVAQFMELYNEEIIDLFDTARDHYGNRQSPNERLRITEDGVGGVRVSGATCKPVRDAADALACLKLGALARTTAATNMNATSSRSHAVFTLHVKQQRLVRADDTDGDTAADPTNEFETLTAKFHFVDLAGSERLKRTGATGERAREGISINCGLLALGNVISALGDKSRKVTHVPYRDSKLTRLLQDSLGGNSQTLMIACVSPSDRDFMETLNTLKYANRARNIKNKVVINQDKSSRTISLLRQEVAQLRMELLEYKQGKRIVLENGEDGINDLFHENTVLQSEVENLRTRVKAMQSTIDRLSQKNSELIAEKTLGAWTKPGDETASCDLTALVKGYVQEIEELRAKLMESDDARNVQRRQMALRNHISKDINLTADSSLLDSSVTIIDEAKKQVNKERELLAKSMSEIEFQRKTSINGENGLNGESNNIIGERERAEGESADDSDASDDSEDDSEDSQTKAAALGVELASLSNDIDTKQRLIEELELSQRRLHSMRRHYEDKLMALQHRIKLTQEERDKVLASYNTTSSGGTSVPSNGNKNAEIRRVREEYERKLSDMSRQLKRLNDAHREHTRLLRSHADSEHQLQQMRRDLHDMKRNKVKLLNKMKEESIRHKRAEDARNREIAQLRKESRRNANLIRGLEAESKLKEQVLKRKREELAAIRRESRRPRARDGGEATRKKLRALERALEEAALRKATIADLEADMERQLAERERLTRELRSLPPDDAEREGLEANVRYVNDAIAEAQQQICSVETNEAGEVGEPGEAEAEGVRRLLRGLRPEEAAAAADTLAALVLRHAHTAQMASRAATRAEARLRELERERQLALEVESTTNYQRSPTDESVMMNNNFTVLSPVNGSMPGGILPGPNNFAHISSGTSTRSVSPVDSSLLELRNDARSLMRMTENGHDKTNNDKSPDEPRFVRSIAARGSVRLRDLGVFTKEDALTRSLHEPSRAVYPLTRVPSAPGDLKGLQPQRPTAVNVNGATCSPLTPQSPRSARRPLQSPLLSPLVSRPNVGASPPGSPLAVRRVSRDDDVFNRLTAAVLDAERIAGGTVKEYDGKWNTRASLQCTHVAEGHTGAVLSLDSHQHTLFSGGVDRTVRVWDMNICREVTCLAGHAAGVVSLAYEKTSGLLYSVAAQHIRVWDIRQNKPIKTLWSSGASGGAGAARGGSLGEVTITSICLSSNPYLYAAFNDKLRLWDIRRFETLGRLSTGHQSAVMCLTIGKGSDNEDVIVTGSKDHYVRVLENRLNSGTCVGVGMRRLLQPPHYDGVQSLCLYNGVLYSGSRDMSIKRWDLSAQEATHAATGAHKGWVTGVKWFQPLNGPVSCGRDGTLRAWDEAIRPLARVQTDDPMHALTVTNSTIYTAGNGGDIKAWRRADGTRC